MKNWHTRLKELRERNGLTMTDLADKMGIHLSQLSKYENGQGASKITGNLKYKLLEVFTPAEVKYIETGTYGTTQSISGNHNNQAGGSQTIQTKEQIDDAIINAIVKMLRDFDEEKKLTALHYITEIRRDKIT